MVENFCLIAMRIFSGGRRGEGVPQNANDDNTHKKEGWGGGTKIVISSYLPY